MTSLQDLPTELDAHIIGYVDHSDIERMTCVSKYYRKVAELLLYHAVYLGVDNDDLIKLLMLTLLGRPDLRPLMQSIEIDYSPQSRLHPLPKLDTAIYLPNNRPQGALYHQLSSQVLVIKDTIEELLGLNFDSQAKLALLAKVLEPFPYFDGALALVILLAHKVKHIDITRPPGHPLPMTRHVLNVD